MHTRTLVVLIALLLVGCGVGAPPINLTELTPTPTAPLLSLATVALAIMPTPTVPPTFTATLAFTPTATAMPSATSVPTATALPPTMPPTMPPTATATSNPPTPMRVPATATAAVFQSPTGPAISIANLPRYPKAQFDTRQSSNDSYNLTVAVAPENVQAWMVSAWRGTGLIFVCVKPWPNWTGAGSFFWRDVYGNGYSFAIIPDVRSKNYGGTNLIISLNPTGGYRTCP